MALVLVVASPSLPLCHSQIPSGWDSQIPLQSSWGEIRGGASVKRPTVLSGGWLSPTPPPGSLFPLEELGDFSERCSVAWGMAVQSTCSCFSYLPVKPVFSVGREVLQPQPCVLGFSQWWKKYEKWKKYICIFVSGSQPKRYWLGMDILKNFPDKSNVQARLGTTE